MFSKKSLLLLFSNVMFTQAISYCCYGSNIFNTTASRCLDGKSPKKLDCIDKIFLPKDDNSSKIEHDEEHNMILDGDIIPPNE